MLPAVSLTITDLAKRARELAGGQSRSLLGITGAPGAGKSTVGAELAGRLGSSTAILVGMDGFHLAQAELERLGRADRKGAPDTFDVDGYAALLRRLRANAEPVVRAPVFRREIEEPVADAVPVPTSVQLVITEGNYLLLDDPGWRDVRAALDEVWFIDVPDDERRRRLVERRMSYGVAEDEAWRWTLGSDEVNAATVAASRDRADLIVHLIDI